MPKALNNRFSKTFFTKNPHNQSLHKLQWRFICTAGHFYLQHLYNNLNLFRDKIIKKVFHIWVVIEANRKSKLTWHWYDLHGSSVARIVCPLGIVLLLYTQAWQTSLQHEFIGRGSTILWQPSTGAQSLYWQSTKPACQK